MRNNKGITLASLIIYIALMFVVLAMLIRVMTYYTGNLSDMADVTWDAQIEKINIYFLDEVQKLGNEVTGCSDNEITFSSGNTYTFVEEESTLYLNNSIKICDNLYYCRFETDVADNGKTVVIVNVTRVETELAKEIRYVMAGNAGSSEVQDTINPLYQEVEYIESTGTQYIDTGIGSANINQMLKIELDFQVTQYINNTWICGTQELECGFSNGFYSHFTYSQKEDYLARTTATGAKKKTTNNKVLLFARDYNGKTTEYRPASVKIYSALFYLDEQLVRDFVPCYRKADGVVGLYDKVYGIFYENAGTGEFKKGADVVTETIVIGNNDNYINEEDYIVQKEENEEILLAGKYKQVEYIESTGTQYVDTGYAPTGNVKIQGKVYTTVSNKEMAVVGSNADGIEIGYSSTTNRFFVYSSNSIGITTTESLYNTILEFTASVTTTPSKELTLHNVGDGKTQTLNSTNLKYQNVILNLFQYKNKYYFQGRLYEMKIYDNDKLVRDFVPCYLKADNEEDIVVGLYDKVEGKFYENSGTGSFIIPE